jgi:type IV secretory pathway VirB2 component (pilin)
MQAMRAARRAFWWRRCGARLSGIVMAVAMAATPAWAGDAGADMPWNGPLTVLLGNLSGPTARVLAGIMLVIGGVLWGFTRHEDGAKRFGQAIFAIAIMFGAVQIVAALQFAGAVV